MTFTLPELPYAYDALGPYMSKETLEFHHDKHHKAYVDTGNKLLEGHRSRGQERRGDRQGAPTARTSRSSTMPASTTTTSTSGSG